MLTLLTGRDKFVSDRLREERGAASGRQSTGSEEEEGGGGGRGALPYHPQRRAPRATRALHPLPLPAQRETRATPNEFDQDTER